MESNEKVTAVIERAADGTYSIYTDHKFDGFALFGYGDTPEEAKMDFLTSYEEMKVDFPELPEQLNVTFKYDIASFLREYKDQFSMSGLQTITGINQKQLHHYLSGHRKPSASTIKRIADGIKIFSERLSAVEFV